MGTGQQKDRLLCGRFKMPTIKHWMIVATVVAWLLFVILFVFGVLLIVGTLGNAHEEVIRFMNCDKPNSAVSCSRVYGYRAEGVVFIILAFFAFGWAMVFTVAIIMGFIRNRRGPRQHGGLSFSTSHAHTAHFATSEA